MPKIAMRHYIYILFLILICSETAFSRDFDQIRRSGYINVAFVQSGLKTINYQFAQEFADYLNVEPRIVIIKWNEIFSKDGKIATDIQDNDSISYTPDALKNADFVCGTTYVYEWRKKFYDFAGYMNVSDLLIMRKKRKSKSIFYHAFVPEKYQTTNQKINVKSFSDLKGLKIAILQNSSYEQNINKINRLIGGGIQIIKTKSEEESQMLARKGEVDGFVTVSYVGLQFVNKNKEFKLAFPIAEPDQVAWAVEKGNYGLAREIDNFFATIKGSGRLGNLFSEQFGVNYDSYLDIINSYTVDDAGHSSDRDLDEILESGKLIVGLRDREMIYHSSGRKQFNHYLAGEFAKYLGVDLEIKIVPNISQYFTNSDGVLVRDSAYTPTIFNSVDVGCDLFVPMEWRLKKIDVVDLLPTANIVVAPKDKEIRSIKDLSNFKAVVSKGSAYEEVLLENGLTNYYYKEGNEFFSELINKKADYTIASIEIYNLQNYPELEPKFVLGEIRPAGWGIKKNQPKLRQKIHEFFQYANQVGILDDAFNEQAGIPFKSAQNHLTALYQTYQNGSFPFVFYGSQQGLPQEDILCIFQDNQGFMWFGTHGGAIKFNGRTMTTYNNQNGLNNNVVFDINQDTLGDIYFATLKGVSVLRGNKFFELLQGVSTKKIYVDKKNVKYFYGDKGLYVYDNGENIVQLNRHFPAIPMSINSIAKSKGGQSLYIASNQGFYVLEDDQKLDLITNKNCTYVFVDEDGQIWLSTRDGVYCGNIVGLTNDLENCKINQRVNVPLDARISKISQNSDGSICLLSDFQLYQLFSLNQTAICYDKKIGLKEQKLLTFMEDSEDNFWFGFSGGLQKLTNRSLRNLFPEELNSLLNNMQEDSYGRIWFAFNNKIYCYQNDLIDFSEKLDGKEIPYVVKVLENDEIFIANSYGCYLLDANTLKQKRMLKFKHKIHNLKNIYRSKDGEIFLITGVDGLVYRLEDMNDQPFAIGNANTTLISQMVEYKNMLIAGNNTGLVKYNKLTFDLICPTNTAVLSLCPVGDLLYVGCEDGLKTFDENGNLKTINVQGLPNSSINAIIQARDKDYLWIGTNNGFSYYNILTKNIEFYIYINDGLPGNEIVTNGLMLNEKGVLYAASFHGVSSFDLKKEKFVKFLPNCRLENILLNGLPLLDNKNVFNANENNFTFELSGLSFKDENSVVYDFYLKGLDNDYVASTGKEHKANYQNLAPGNYEFAYRAKGKDGLWNYTQSFKFMIEKPFYFRWWFIVLCVITLGATIYYVVKARELQLRRRNMHLERMVTQRTAEIQKQKNDIEAKNVELEAQREQILKQNDELEKQKNIAVEQKNEIESQQKEIMDSIHYAKRIQSAILPSQNAINLVFPEHFVLYLPRDIVSGDFYYFKQVGKYAVIVAADCTGHGVPGACMSMLGSAYINEIVVNNQDNLNAGRVLDDLRKNIIESLHQTGRFDEAKDGMDIALCVLDLESKIIQYSGAFNPLVLVRQGEITEYEADRMPIGIHDNVHINFTNYDLQCQEGDQIYIFSDGYASQFGGKYGKKYMTSRFKKLLLEASKISMTEQKELLTNKIYDWMGAEYEQVDDILVIGFKID